MKINKRALYYLSFQGTSKEHIENKKESVENLK